MQVGLGTGARGADVERLQHILASQGQAIDPGELERSEFGPSTLAALQAFQSGSGLRRTGSMGQQPSIFFCAEQKVARARPR
jgi:hypothetical protein